jgi:hypothetical protein
MIPSPLLYKHCLAGERAVTGNKLVICGATLLIAPSNLKAQIMQHIGPLDLGTSSTSPTIIKNMVMKQTHEDMPKDSSQDVADGNAMWWIMVWLALQVRMEEPDRVATHLVARQIRSIFAATPDFATNSDADRQRSAEFLLMQTFMFADLIKASAQDPGLAAQHLQIAQEGAKATGLDLSLMTLNPRGFVARKGG